MNFFLFAGEASGDLHGSHLIKSIKKENPSASFQGVGGSKMIGEGLNALIPMEKFAVMGFTDVLFALPRLWKLFYQVRDAIILQQPKAVILIDYPDFNLRLAKALRKKNYSGKIVHYISPSVWAWRKGRIWDMAKTLDLLLTIYPFEAQYYKPTNLPVKFVGNPIKEYVASYQYKDWKEKLKIPSHAPLVALFPGSRHSEIHSNLPLQLSVAKKLLTDQPEAVFGISCVTGEQEKAMHEIVQKFSLQINRELFLIPREYTYELMQGCHTAIAKSGTITLELALHQRPTVVMYQTSFLNRFVAKYLFGVNLPFYCIVNILANAQVFPEFIESSVSEENLHSRFNEIHQEGQQRQQCLEGCRLVSNLLSIPDASSKAAKAILELCHDS